MSMRALLQATRDHLRGQLELDDRSCEVMFDGRPPPWCGEEFFSVHQRSWRGNHGDQDIDELYGLDVTYTRRLNGMVPWDRTGVALLLKTPDGVYERVEAARVKLHKSYTVMNAANLLIPALVAGDTNGFEEPYLLATLDTPRAEGPRWFRGKGTKDCAIVMAIHLEPARRLQELTAMT